MLAEARREAQNQFFMSFRHLDFRFLATRMSKSRFLLFQAPQFVVIFYGSPREFMGLPLWLRWERICLQCRRLGLDREDPLEEGMAVHSSILAWRIPWTEEPGRLQSVPVAKSLQSSPTLYNPMDFSLPGSSVHGILQARILEWVAISFSRGSSLPTDQTQISRIGGRRFNL